MNNDDLTDQEALAEARRLLGRRANLLIQRTPEESFIVGEVTNEGFLHHGEGRTWREALSKVEVKL